MQTKTTFTVATILAFVPTVVVAGDAEVSGPQLDYVSSLVFQAGDLIEALLPIVVALALLFFFWGIAVFILNAGDEEARGRGISHMIWGVVALFLIVAIWGIVEVIAQIFGVNTGGSAAVPGVGGTDTRAIFGN